MLYIKAKFTSYRFGKNTYELKFTSKEFADKIILEQSKGEGFLLFSPDEIKKQVEEAIKNKRIGINYKGKTKSEILRGTIYSIWANANTTKSFEQFYSESMDFIINHFTKKYL